MPKYKVGDILIREKCHMYTFGMWEVLEIEESIYKVKILRSANEIDVTGEILSELIASLDIYTHARLATETEVLLYA